MEFTTLLPYLSAIITAIAGWFVGRRKRKLDAINSMQQSIDTLIVKNNELLDEIITVKTENADLKIAVNSLSHQNETLHKELSELKEYVKKIKSITPKK